MYYTQCLLQAMVCKLSLNKEIRDLKGKRESGNTGTTNDILDYYKGYCDCGLNQ